MKKNYIKLLTGVALVAVLFLQGIWLYNTYILLEKELNENLTNIFISSIENESYLRSEDPTRKGTWKQKIINGFHPNNDRYTNIKALQNFLYVEGYPISLKNVDSIFNEQIKKNYGDLKYSLSIYDSLNYQTAYINHGLTKINEHLSYRETVQLRDYPPEYITVIIADPYKIILGKMIFLLIGSLLSAIFVVYCLIKQINIISQQKKIAKIRQDFSHALIHDMKNPVTTILLAIDQLKSGMFENKPQEKEIYYGIITEEGKRVLNLSNKVLTIAHLEEGTVNFSKQLIDLSDLIKSLTDKYIVNPKKKITFHIELNGVEFIYADPQYIYEAFSNIIDNAIKYSKEKEDVEIYITSSRVNNYTQINFKDKGIGISPEDQKKLFKKFERASSANNRKIDGFGLGLNFVYQVVLAHDGEICVNSESGNYSEFIINLPYNNENDQITID